METKKNKLLLFFIIVSILAMTMASYNAVQIHNLEENYELQLELNQLQYDFNQYQVEYNQVNNNVLNTIMDNEQLLFKMLEER